MYKILAVKMLHEIKQNIVQFLAIFAMAFITLFVVSGLGTVGFNQLDRYLDETNYRDLEVTGRAFTYDDIDKVGSIPEVASVEAWYTTTGKTTGAVTEDEEKNLYLSYVTANDICRCFIIEGEEFSTDKDGIWLDDKFCEAEGICVGDTFNFDSEGAHHTEIVRGMVRNPEYLYYIADSKYIAPKYGEYGFGILNISEHPSKTQYFTQLLVDLNGVPGNRSLNKEISQINDLASTEIKQILDDNELIVTAKRDSESIKQYYEYTDTSKSMLIIFPALFGCIAMLGIMSTMSRMIARQRTTIGALKALGITSTVIHIHYILYSLVLIVAGCILGTLVGFNTLGNMMFRDMVLYFLNPYEHKIFTSLIYIVSVGLVVASIVVTYMCNRKLLSSATARILQPEAPKDSTGSVYEKMKFWQKLKFVTRWNIRDIANNRLRTLISIMGIIICSMLIFGATGFYEILRAHTAWQYEKLITAKSAVYFESGTSLLGAQEYAQEYSGQLLEYESIVISTEDKSDKYNLTVYDEGNCFHIADGKREYIDFPETGVTMTEKAAKELGVSAGDLVTFSIDGEEDIYSARVSTLCCSANKQGLIISREGWEEMHGEFKPDTMYTRMTVPEELEDKDEIAAVKTNQDLQDAINVLIDAVMSKIAMIIIVAIFLGGVILYNLGSLSYSEKIKDLATLKVLGFSSKNLKKILMQQNIAITIIGSLIGIPPGFLVIKMLINMMGDDTDAALVVSAMPYIVAFVATMLLSVAINSLIVSRIEDINMVETLKGG